MIYDTESRTSTKTTCNTITMYIVHTELNYPRRVGKLVTPQHLYFPQTILAVSFSSYSQSPLPQMQCKTSTLSSSSQWISQGDVSGPATHTLGDSYIHSLHAAAVVSS